MNGDQHDIVGILVKYALHEPLDKEEERLLAGWRERSPEHAMIPEQFRDQEWLEEQRAILHEPPTDAMWEDIQAYMERGAAPVVTMRTRRWVGLAWYPVAALFLAGAVFGGMRWRPSRMQKEQVAALEVPARYQALLALDDGTKIVLDTLKVGAIVAEGQLRIRKADSNSYIYTAGVLADGAIRHRLTVAPGVGTVKIQWPDNSTAVLNGGTSIDYPVDLRVAETKLEGRAWFRVTHNAGRPVSIVLPDGAEVRVLGTSFEVASNAERPESSVSLFSGSVRMVQGKDSVLLRPGSQAVAGAKGIATGDIDPESLAWTRPPVKDGYFDLTNADLVTFGPEISRWYHVEVVNPRHLRGVGITGALSRKTPLPALIDELRKIERTHVRIELKEDTLTIAPPKPDE